MIFYFILFFNVHFVLKTLPSRDIAVYIYFVPQSPGSDSVQPRADHHVKGLHRGVLKCRAGSDEENQGVV